MTLRLGFVVALLVACHGTPEQEAQRNADREARAKTPVGFCERYLYDAGYPGAYSCACAGWDCDARSGWDGKIVQLRCSPEGCVSRGRYEVAQ